jgi:Flp pilus assembly protein TadG
MKIKISNFRNNKKNEKGQSTVELALFIPFILFVTFFAVEIVLGSYYGLVLNNVVREVARIVSVSEGENPSVTQTKVNNLLNRFSTDGPLRLEVNDPALFSLTWQETLLDTYYKQITVQTTYRGLKLPFIGPLNISASIIFPKLSLPPGII